MSNWKKAVAKYSAESRNFDNFTGEQMRDSFVGQASNSFVGQSYANGQNAQMGGDFSYLNDGNKYYTIVITNTQTSGDDVTAVIFGAYQYGASATQPNAGVTVTVSETSHAEARAASMTEPFWVNGFRYEASNAAQLAKVWTIQNRSSNGVINSWQVRPNVFKTSYQNQSLQIDAPGYKFGVDGSTSVQIPVAYSQNATLTLQLGGRYSASNIVQGASSVEVASQRELATGLVQVVK